MRLLEFVREERTIFEFLGETETWPRNVRKHVEIPRRQKSSDSSGLEKVKA